MEFNSELILQRITQNNLQIFDLKFISTECQCQGQRFDTLAFDENTNSFTIIEYKNKIDFQVLSQGESYYNLLLENKDIYINKYNEVFNTDLSKKDFEFDSTKVLIIGPEFSKDQIKEAHTPSYPFEIWKVDLNENFCITYENVVTNERKHLQVSEDELKLTEDELLYDKTQKVIDLFKSIKNQVENEFPDANIKILVDAFSYRLNDKLICKFIFLKNYLNLYFYTDEIEDIEGKLEDISGKNLEGNTYYRFKLTSEEDIDYFIELFRQIYR